MSRREEYKLKFQKIEDTKWSTYYHCDGTTGDNRSLFIATILRGHNDLNTTEIFLEEIDLALAGKFEDMDEFWQPDSLTDTERCYIIPPNIILGKEQKYTLPLQNFRELLQEWLSFLNS
jgi:hypothetical protein